MSQTSLVACPDCGHSVSRQAVACPNCGRKLGKGTGQALFDAFFWAVMVACGLVAVSFVAWLAVASLTGE